MCVYLSSAATATHRLGCSVVYCDDDDGGLVGGGAFGDGDDDDDDDVRASESVYLVPFDWIRRWPYCSGIYFSARLVADGIM